MQTIEEKVLSRIYGKKRGWVFTPAAFLDLGSSESVWKALEKLCDRQLIRRLARGLYDYPKEHPKLGVLTPTPDEIAEALAGKDRLRILPSGAYAANLLGLSLQVPARVVFLTDGAERNIKVGRQEIILKRTTPRNMAAAGRVSGLVIQALRHLGQEHVDDEVLRKLNARLTDDDRRTLLKDIPLAPAWIGNLFRRLAKENA
ncbi:MAG: hypothetical protein IAG10_14870 [Planctomycetaceae bacterium]|nr:hypothetical protein [Planctomycetaceae bacterium]